MSPAESIGDIYIPDLSEIASLLKSFGYSGEEVEEFLRQIKYFEDEAPKRDDIVRRYLSEEQINRIVESVVLEFQRSISGSLNILDVGAGSGFFTKIIIERLQAKGLKSIKVFGLDLCPRMLKVLFEKNIYPIWGLAENLVECIDFLRNRYGLNIPKKFDYILSILAFHHFLDPEKALLNLSKILELDGKVVVVDVLRYENEELRREMMDVRPGFDLKEFELMALKYFDYVKVEKLRGVSCCEKGFSVGLFKAVLKL